LVDAESFSDGINLYGKLLFERFAFASFKSLIVNEVGGFFDEHSEDIFNALVFLFNVVLASFLAGSNRIVFSIEITSRLVIGVTLVHELRALTTANRSSLGGAAFDIFLLVRVIQEVENSVCGAFPWN